MVCVLYVPHICLLCTSKPNPAFGKRLVDNVVIVHPTRLSVYRKHFMPLLSQPCGYRWASGFVHEKSHLRLLHGQWHEGSVF